MNKMILLFIIYLNVIIQSTNAVTETLNAVGDVKEILIGDHSDGEKDGNEKRSKIVRQDSMIDPGEENMKLVVSSRERKDVDKSNRDESRSMNENSSNMAAEVTRDGIECTTDKFIKKFIATDENNGLVPDEPWLWTQIPLTAADLGPVCWTIWKDVTDYDQTVLVRREDGQLFLQAPDSIGIPIEYLQCRRVTGEEIYVTAPLDKDSEKLTLLDKIDGGFMLRVPQDSIKRHFTPYMRLFALQTGGISPSDLREYKSRNIRRNASWTNGPILKDALVGICNSFKNLFLWSDVEKVERFVTALDMGCELGIYEKAEILSCKYKKGDPTFHVAAPKNRNPRDLVWNEVELVDVNLNFKIFRFKRPMCRGSNEGYFIDAYGEPSLDNNLLIWSIFAIPEFSLNAMCVSAVTKLTGSSQDAKMENLEVNGDINFEPYGENRSGDILHCSYLSNDENKEKSMAVVPVEILEGTEYIKLIKDQNISKYVISKATENLNTLQRQYESRLTDTNEVVRRARAAIFAEFGTSHENKLKFQFDEHKLFKIVMDYKCQETMKQEIAYRQYYHTKTEKIRLSFSQSSIEEFKGKELVTEAVVCSKLNDRNDEMQEQKEHDNSVVRRFIISPFDDKSFIPVRQNSDDGIFYFEDGERFHFDLTMNILMKTRQEDLMMFNSMENYPLLPQVVKKQCMERFREEDAINCGQDDTNIYAVPSAGIINHEIWTEHNTVLTQLQSQTVLYQCTYFEYDKILPLEETFKGCLSQLKLVGIHFEIREEDSSEPCEHCKKWEGNHQEGSPFCSC